jgi:hypothetical protein
LYSEPSCSKLTVMASSSSNIMNPLIGINIS